MARRALLLALGLMLVPAALAQAPCVGECPTEAQVKALFDDWNAALATLNSTTVAAMYHPDAVLLPTVSNQVRDTPAKIKAYFDTFLLKKPQGVVDPANSEVKVLTPTLAAHYGIYTFTLTNSDGSKDIVPARFSYTYIKENGRWLILEHHSSALPEVALPEVAEVDALFTAWNAALATLEPETVADMYAPNAVLLPTVSNQVRDTRDEIVDYFTLFLTKKPQGVIDVATTRVLSPSLASRSGIYTFTLRDADNKASTVKARFTYVYTKVKGVWKILEHHSSALPEATITQAQVRDLFSQWNAALATLDPVKVADMYHPDGVLLPTVSNEVRNTRAEILNYFESFLLKKPQGVLNESHVRILAPDTAAHYGIYTFTLTDEKTGAVSKVGARFSYTYKLYNDKWLIIEHHSSALPETTKPTETEVKALFDAWNAALATLDPAKVADMYAPDGVLLPTISNQVRDTRAEIIAYFEDFLLKKPQGVIDESYVRIFSATSAAHYGIYTFTLTDAATGKVSRVGARFSYTYSKIGDKWLIAEHHSSALPEAVMPTATAIRALFDDWNAALATLNPVSVADKYAPDGILLPTVSNQMRTTRAEIIDYFTTFLTKKPQGVIDQSTVRIIGPTAAAHYGIYTFTLTNSDGSKQQVPARFSYTYTKADGNWKILEHHSSVLPEGQTVPAVTLPTENAIRELFNVWNAALATLNSATVADLYHPQGVLLPTVSNQVRNTRALILDYFNMFLKKKPQGVINESHVRIFSGTMAAHYGIYTFTLTDEKTGKTSQVGARFSYTYTKVDDKWLIAEHHSSALPEVSSTNTNSLSALEAGSPEQKVAQMVEDSQDDLERIVYGVGLGVGLGMGTIVVLLVAYAIVLIKRIAPMVPSATMVIEPHADAKV